ncbi:MAG: conjugal transfer protein TraD, partial [Parvularcula sp.]|nr:conjugal transfer protein TraD [Parvularcula sp.]
ATGADALDAETLAGALLDAVANTDKATGEGWRKRGAAFFHGKSRDSADRPRQQPEGTLPLDGGSASA